MLVAKPRSGFAGLRLWRQLARGAQGIAAESPQEAHRLVAILLSQNRCSPMHPGRFRGLAAESPVFFARSAGKKNAP
jgi:hypothetical protein